MRSPRHWLKKHYGELRIHGRRKELEREMSEGLGRTIKLTRFGDGGNDSIYLATDGNQAVAVVRLHNPFKKNFLRWKKVSRELAGPTTGPRNNDPMKALNREWDACQALVDSGVTPRPLWRTHDAIAVSHIHGTRLNHFLKNRNAEDWQIPVSSAFGALAGIHQLGRAHHDAKVSNIVFDESAGRACFIDLDRPTLHGTPLAEQQALDYLKLLSSFLQIAPRKLREDPTFWLRAITPHAPPAVRRVEVSPLLRHRSLRHLNRSYPVRTSLTEVFQGIAPE